MLTYVKFLKVVLINMVSILKMSPNWHLGLLKINLFQNKGYEVIFFVHDVINKILSRDSNYKTDVVMRPKFGNFSISTTSILQGFDQKNQYF